MAEIWRYQDRLAAAQLLAKRPRTEIDNFQSADNAPLLGSAGYGRGDLRFDDRDARLLDYGLDAGKAGAAYGSAYLSADITGLGNGTLLGAGVAGALRAQALGLSALEDPRLAGVDSGLLKGGGVGLNGARSDILFGQDARPSLHSLHSDQSPTLFLEGLPLDCTRREVSHIFRPFHGFKEVRVVKKGSNRSERFLLCFVEFKDAFSAVKALEGLRGYKLDEEDGDSEPLRLQFAQVAAPRSGVHTRNRRRR